MSSRRIHQNDGAAYLKGWACRQWHCPNIEAMSTNASVVVTPRGTRGQRMPRLPGPLTRSFTEVMYRIFRKRPFMGMSILRVTTVGARSGQQRHTVLSYFPDGNDAWLIVGSAGGAITHPAWYFNMARHPDQVWIEFGSRKLKVRPQTLQGEARARAWKRIVDVAPQYAGYLSKTDREIPVIRLSAA